MNPIIRFQNVTKRFGALTVLDDFNFEVARGEKVTLIGPSGSGKSTVLRILMTLEPFQEGQIEIDGIGYHEPNGRGPFKASEQHLHRIRSNVGMVFQSFNLFRHMTVLDNVMSGPVHVLRMPKPQAEALARELLAKVGLPDKANRYPSELSGGQQQRVAIARALALSPSVMLLDEPTSALDPELSQEVILTIRNLAEQGYTMLIATHEMAIAREFADRVIFMVQGEVVEDVPARSFFSAPRHERSRQFVARHAG